MATPVVDPSKIKYFPEMLPEALNEPSVSVAGQKVASYNMSDRRCVIENIECMTPTANLDLVVSTDSGEKCRIRSDSPANNDPRRYHKISARETMDFSAIMTAGGPTANVRFRWNMTFRRPLPIDKRREGAQLDTEEGPISELVNLDDNLSLGTIPYWQSLMHIDPAKLFDDVIPVDKELAAMAAASESVVGGSPINVPNPNSQLIVLLGVMIDRTALPATPSDTFLVIDRDIDSDYVRLDVTAITSNQYIPCYIPALKKLEVRVESATGSGGGVIPVGFSYGIRKLNVADYIRWKLPYNSPIARSDAQALISKYNSTAKKIQAGMI